MLRGAVHCLIVVAAGIFLATGASAQSLSSFRTQRIAVVTDTISLDSLSLVPGSVQINGSDSLPVTIDYLRSTLVFPDSLSWPDSVDISYRVLPLPFAQPFAHKDVSLIRPNIQGTSNPFVYTKPPSSNSSAYFSELEKRGSISRGINFGNAQNLGVNSNLNLQLSGKLTEKISVLAAISDENVPIQPDGNTQQIQDFDQVYIQVYTDQNKLVAGDYQITNTKSHFMRYQKRLRGLSAESAFSLTKDPKANHRMEAGGSAAVSRGKFARNIVQGVEGNQGPYRLRGEENENFIIILSGTENVYIDGRKLTRGQENDYVIDYNNAEITFTARQPITKDKRIIIEFQYSSQAYARSLAEVHTGYYSDKLDLRLDVYTEQDSRNQPLQQDLTDEQRRILEEAGDDLDATLAPSAEQVEFDNGEVLYKRVIDTSSTGEIDTIFVYSTNPDSAIYRVRFTDLGPGNGDYIAIQSSGNGQVYEYIAPLSGQPQGRYEPVIVLITPKLRQMATMGGAYRFSENTSLTFEGAVTRQDLNTFSSRDDEDNIGHGLAFDLKTRKALAQKEDPWYVTAGVQHEQISAEFSEIERFRSVEFDRDWNIRDLTLTDDQYLPGVSVGLSRSSIGSMAYQFKSFFAGQAYEAVRHGLVADIDTRKYRLTYDGSYTDVTGTQNTSEFLRHKTLAKRHFKHFSVGYRDDLENNVRLDPSADTLLPISYRFWEWEVFLESPDSLKNRYRISYNNRADYAARNDEVRQSTLGESYGLEFALTENPNSQLKGKATYRVLRVLDSILYTSEPEENLISRLEYTLRLFKGAVTSTSFYEIGSGLEERRDFVYVEVSPGQGVFTWIDANENGIKELNEFEVAAFVDQANYVRVSVATNNFIRTYTNQFNQVLFLQPARVWNKSTGLRKFLSRFADQIAYRVDRKTNREDNLNRFNPFVGEIADSALISTNASFRNTLYFNRTHPVYGVEYSYQDIRNKNQQTNGFEARDNRFQDIDLRYNFIRDFQWNVLATLGEKSNRSEFFENRNFEIAYLTVGPKLSYLPNTALNIALTYSYQEQINADRWGGEQVFKQDVGLEMTWNKVGKGSLMVQGNFIVIDFDGEANSATGYEMLQGLLPGENGTWEATIQRQLGKNLQLNLTYNGRKSQETQVIHTGGVQVRAFF